MDEQTKREGRSLLYSSASVFLLQLEMTYLISRVLEIPLRQAYKRVLIIQIGAYLVSRNMGMGLLASKNYSDRAKKWFEKVKDSDA